MGNQAPVFKGVYDAMETAFTAYHHQDWELCREALDSFFKIISIDEARTFTPRDFIESGEWFSMLVQTGLDCSPEGTTAREFFMRVSAYFIKHSPPELKAKMHEWLREAFPEIQPVGYDDSGQACYSIADVAPACGITEKEALELLEGANGDGGCLIPADHVHQIQ